MAADFDRRCNQLARLLIEHGVGPGVSVVLALGGSGESVLAYRAVALVGADVVPVDPRLPRAAIIDRISRSRADLGLTLAEFSAPLPGSVHWIELDNPDVIAEWSQEWPGPLTVRDRSGALWARSMNELRHTGA
ncbi:AMP-binding protein [Antrihabitans sp. YC2-6]|uniref:AMP-binding protein n=1 Tax=Antrihabitans sp. YC2-6 TaxID=2799498 RepID=UPI0018F5B532|nr:AMP-binding protein [Antrihabitans sp. YC2-6]MBJ8346225.1 AMP-binding protein [Antrihabitans sp. YC2-6]